MLNELQTWWQNTTPELQIALHCGSVALAALLPAYLLGNLVVRALRARKFDAFLRVPSAEPRVAEEDGITPTFVAGLLVRLTIWAGAAWWLAFRHEQAELARTLGL